MIHHVMIVITNDDFPRWHDDAHDADDDAESEEVWLWQGLQGRKERWLETHMSRWKTVIINYYVVF